MTGQRILAVDDERIVRALVIRVLESAGFQVGLAENVKEAIASVEREPPDLIVSDVDMPGGSGLDLCRELADRHGPGIPVILLSGRGAEADILAGFEAGAADYLLKPLDNDELLAKVRLHLRHAGTAVTGHADRPAGPVHTIADGRVRLGEQLGVGGMGAVYRGDHLTLGRPVAVKVLRPDLATDPDYVVRFLREARALSKLQLPGVPRVHDVGRDGERYYYVMDLLEGATLYDHVKDHGTLSGPEALQTGLELTRILAEVEQHDLIHRDVKPENVLLMPGNRIGLVDFGLARGLRDSRLTEPDSVMGTLGFIAPEQLVTDAEPDIRGDLYGVGMTLAFAVRGYSPPGTGARALVAAANATRVELAPEPPDAVPGFAPLVTRLTEPDPLDRPQTAAEAYALFQELSADAAQTGI